ncbi:MAG: hypothetical protein CMK32_01070 [Porticoccaceae bacterium]|nr:hypothetical protein [Porticoccaceae bacterium]
MAETFQRVGSISNAHVGRDFEVAAKSILTAAGIPVVENYPVEVGVNNQKKLHYFDLGSGDPPVIVECKSHRWTSGDNVPSAKVTVWNEAMFYFHCAPSHYRKIFFVLRDKRKRNGETLAGYYLRTYGHLVPESVEIWELDEKTGQCDIIHASSN